jgi:uncharacterized protein (TIGR03437 family)
MSLLASLATALLINVLTYQYDNTRAGVNSQEVILTPANVDSSQFGKLFSQPVDGVLYGQPLYLAGVAIPGQGTHNVIYVATEHDSVYAFDADTNQAPLWHTSFLGAGVTTVPAADTGCSQIVPEIGITSTPVIDPQSGAIYVVAMTKESGNYVQRLHALDVATGAEKPGSPVVIQASAPGTGEGGTTVVFQPKAYKQRPGLLLLNGVVYTLWSSHCDLGTYHGWIIGYDAHSLQQVTVYNDTPNGNEASFWNGGAAPAVDSAGNMYVVAANGTTDFSSPTNPDLGESYIRLTTNGGLALADYFTPFNYAQLNSADADTGSAGVALLGDEAGSAAHPHLMAGAGKEGRIYLLDRDNLGKFNSAGDTQTVQSIPGAIGGLFGNPAYFNARLYFCSSGDPLKAFPISNARMTTTPQSQSPTTFPYPGCVPTISANGTSNGIVWAIDPQGLLRAYDATNLANELYNSNQNSARDSLGSPVRFSVPTVANGKVYVGTQNALVVYGPLTPPIAVSNAASGNAAALAPGSLASLYGTNLPVSPSLTVGGLAAPIFAAFPSQINFQIPFEAPTGAATVNLLANGATVASTSIPIQTFAPGLFTESGGQAAVLNQDYSVNTPGNPASVGSYIAAYLTGLGPVQPPVTTGALAPLNVLSFTTNTVTATIGGAPATVVFAGLAPGFAGLYQVNMLVPQLSPGRYPLQVSIGGTGSNTAYINIQ